MTDGAHTDETLVLVRQRNAQIKIEVTPVLRGTVYPTQLRTVRPIVEDQFGFAEIQVVHLPTSMQENWLPHWTDSILGIYSTLNTCLRMRVSIDLSTRHFWHTS